MENLQKVYVSLDYHGTTSIPIEQMRLVAMALGVVVPRVADNDLIKTFAKLGFKTSDDPMIMQNTVLLKLQELETSNELFAEQYARRLLGVIVQIVRQGNVYSQHMAAVDMHIERLIQLRNL